MTECACGCHQQWREAIIKMREARKEGSFYYYHNDCYCCPAAHHSNFGALDAIHEKREKGL